MGWGSSPNAAHNHSIFELSFRASPGGFGVQFKDPGPRYSCEVLETEPIVVVGNATDGGGSEVAPVDGQNWSALVPPTTPAFHAPCPIARRDAALLIPDWVAWFKN